MASSSGRGRARKVGLGRMDAALDAMRSMGFPGDLVRKTVKELLKVYGGHEGWAFIEEASYKVLIDAILESQEQCETEKSEKEQKLLEDKMQEEENENENENVHSTQVHSPQKPMDIVACSTKNDKPRKELGIEVQDLQVESAQVHHPQSRSPPPLEVSTCLSDTSQDNLAIQVPSPTPLALLPRKRKPCYGWISSDDEEEILTSTPAA